MAVAVGVYFGPVGVSVTGDGLVDVKEMVWSPLTIVKSNPATNANACSIPADELRTAHTFERHPPFQAGASGLASGVRACAPIDSRAGMIGWLHERERDLGVISGALDEVAAGAGRVVVVEGPAGIGKTSLLQSARDAAQARNFAVAGARGSELEHAYAWGVVRQLLEPRLRGMSGEARGRTLAGAAALAAPIVLPDGAAPPGDADPSFGVLHGLYWLVAALAAERPQLLVVDDLHWADGASVRFVEFLANRHRRRPGVAAGGAAAGCGGGWRCPARGAARDVDRALAVVVGGDGGRAWPSTVARRSRRPSPKRVTARRAGIHC